MEGTRTGDIRIFNRKRLVNMLFHQGPMTRAELAKRLDISLPTTTLLLRELAEKGLVTDGQLMNSTGGRPPLSIQPVYDIRLAVGVEVSMHEIRMVVEDIGNNVCAKASWPYGLQMDQEYWRMVNGLLESFISDNVQIREKLLSVGMCIQLPIDHGKVLHKTKDPQKLDLEMVKRCFDRPVEIQNSAKMAAIAQIWTGPAKENFVFLSLGTYVSGAVICQPNVWEFDQPNGMFGSLIDGGKKLEDVLTIGALTAKAGVEDLEAVFSGIESGRESCADAWENYLDVLSQVIYNLRRIFGYEIVIGGAVSPYLESSQDALYGKIKALEEFEGLETPYFSISDLGEYGAAIGAAMLPINRFLDFGFEEL